MPVLDREEYIEQAYFFQAFRERLIDGLPSQEILARIGEELLSTTKLPMAVSFLHRDQGHRPDGPGHGPDQPLFHAVSGPRGQQAENDVSRFAMDQALLILEREAKFKADAPSLPACSSSSSRPSPATGWATPRAWPRWPPTRSIPKTGATTS